MTLHVFDDTGEAYDATQCRDEIKTGDTLVIERERVVGLAWAWPIAITERYGVLHTANKHWKLCNFPFTEEQVNAAKAEAEKRGYPIRAEWL